MTHPFDRMWYRFFLLTLAERNMVVNALFTMGGQHRTDAEEYISLSQRLAAVPPTAVGPDVGKMAFTVPLLPPSVNHYKRPRRGGGFFRAAEAIGFVDAVCIFSRKMPVPGKWYEIDITFSLPPAKHRLNTDDLDNFLKVALDGLGTAGVISNDGAVLDLHVHKRFVETEQDAKTDYLVIGREATDDPTPNSGK